MNFVDSSIEQNSRSLGVFSPLFQVCSLVVGPAIGHIVSKDAPAPPIVWALYICLGGFFASYLTVVLFGKTLTYTDEKRRLEAERLVHQRGKSPFFEQGAVRRPDKPKMSAMHEQATERQ